MMSPFDSLTPIFLGISDAIFWMSRSRPNLFCWKFCFIGTVLGVTESVKMLHYKWDSERNLRLAWRVVWRIGNESRLSRSGAHRRVEKQVRKKKSERVFHPLTERTPAGQLLQTLGGGCPRRSNQQCQVLYRYLKGFWLTGVYLALPARKARHPYYCDGRKLILKRSQLCLMLHLASSVKVESLASSKTFIRWTWTRWHQWLSPRLPCDRNKAFASEGCYPSETDAPLYSIQRLIKDSLSSSPATHPNLSTRQRIWVR